MKRFSPSFLNGFSEDFEPRVYPEDPRRNPLKKLLFLFLAGFSVWIFTSCGTTKQVQLVERIHQDTIYRNKLQYDSIFIHQDRSQEYHLNPLNPLKPSETDTLFVKDVSIEYRYRLLRDTVKLHQVDSIPVIKEVEVTREVRYIPWWSKVLNWIGLAALAAIFVQFVIFVFKHKKYIP